jgi:hypothetical protein
MAIETILGANMTDLNEYGKLIRIYEGSGILHLKDDSELRCHFELAQVSDGRLYALCHTAEPDRHMGLDEDVVKLSGEVHDGKILTFEHLTLMRKEFSFSQEAASSHAIFYGKQAIISEPDLPVGSLRVRFALTNLTLLGTEKYTIQHADGGTFGGLQLSLNLDGFEIAVRPVDSYRDIIRGLKATRGIDVTCEAAVASVLIEQEDTVVRVIEDLCTLLTLARGCRVQWIYYDVMGSDGKVFKSFHRSAITKPFGTLSLIATNPADDTLDFVTKTYSNLHTQERPWELRKAIDAYTDAKLEEDYLEFRGLKMAITVEHLKGRYLSQQGKVHILNCERFDNVVNSLVNVVRWVLPAVFPGVEEEKLDMMANHARGFNWYPFGRALSELCKSLGLQMNSAERRRFKSIRDELVHRAAFHLDLGNRWEQYRFMMTFVGKLLLAILGYDGYYYDWTKEPGWEGVDLEMRVKLDLENQGYSSRSKAKPE